MLPASSPTPAARARLARLCRTSSPELGVALAVHGVHPSAFGLTIEPPPKPETVLDELFEGLAFPPRAPPGPPIERSLRPLSEDPRYARILRAGLRHPPGMFRGKKTAPPVAPGPPQMMPHAQRTQPMQVIQPMQQMQQMHSQPTQQSHQIQPQRRFIQPEANAGRQPFPAHAYSVPPPEPRPMPPPRSLQPPKPHPMRQGQGNTGAVIDLENDDENTMDVDDAIDFEAELAQDSRVLAKREGRVAPPRQAGRQQRQNLQPDTPSPPPRRKAHVSDDDDSDAGRTRKRGRGRAAERSIANNPYCAGFQQQQQMKEQQQQHYGDGGDFRTARDKYDADLRAKGKGAGTRGKRPRVEEEDEGDGMDVARTISKAVLGPRRARFSAPKKAGEKGKKTPVGGKEKEENSALREALLGAVVTDTPNVRWDDVAGLTAAKEALKETVILPKRFPEMFGGNRKPWKGILLYGPPGTGKSYLAKAVATEAESFFISVSSSDLVSKWQGESEKLVKEMFALAREEAPSIVFIDEIDSLVSSRSDGDSESSRRIKTEFLVQMDGVGNGTDGVLVLGATNIPWGLDDALLRRMERRVYIPLPDAESRALMFKLHTKEEDEEKVDLSEEDFEALADMSEGFSGSDIKVLSRDANMTPIRIATSSKYFKKLERGGVMKYTPCSPDDPAAEHTPGGVMSLTGTDVLLPSVNKSHFEQALKNCKPSVGQETLNKFKEFTSTKGQDGR